MREHGAPEARGEGFAVAAGLSGLVGAAVLGEDLTTVFDAVDAFEAGAEDVGEDDYDGRKDDDGVEWQKAEAAEAECGGEPDE